MKREIGTAAGIVFVFILFFCHSGISAYRVSDTHDCLNVNGHQDCTACVTCHGVELDEYGFYIMTFENKCDYDVTLNVCVRHESGATRHGKPAKAGETVQINLGKIVPDQTLVWTCDGSDPCE